MPARDVVDGLVDYLKTAEGTDLAGDFARIQAWHPTAGVKLKTMPLLVVGLAEYSAGIRDERLTMTGTGGTRRIEYQIVCDIYTAIIERRTEDAQDEIVRLADLATLKLRNDPTWDKTVTDSGRTIQAGWITDPGDNIDAGTQYLQWRLTCDAFEHPTT